MKLTLALCAAALIASASAHAQDPAPGAHSGVMLDRIIAVVNEGVVLQSELEAQINNVSQRLRDQNQPLPPRSVMEEQLLERLIVARIQLQRAERIGIRVDDEQLNRALAAVARRNELSLRQLPDALAAQGIDYAEYREEMRNEMVIEQLRARDVLARISVMPSEIERKVDESIAQDRKIEYNVRHILLTIPSGATPEKVAEIEVKAGTLHERLSKGENFGRMAIAYSGGPNAMQGGDLGWKPITELPTLFTDAISSLDDGEVSTPIRSPSGFHIIQLAGRRGDDKVVIKQRNVRHILVQTNEVVSDEDAYAKIEALRERIEAGEPFGDIAREESDDKASATDGGDMGWSNPGTFVAAFEAAMATLRTGELSAPVRSEFGWHLIELLGTRDYDGTDDVKRGQIVAELRREKQDSETTRWLRKLRDEAYVEIRL